MRYKGYKSKKEYFRYHKEYREKNNEFIKQKRREIKNKNPWIYSYYRAKQRCTNQECQDYYWYGDRGIKFLLSKEDYKFLWNRDKAYLMKKPTIDRINADKNYVLENCQFLEKSKNSAKDKCKKILQYSLDGKFIKEWNSLTEVESTINIDARSVGSCARGKYSHAGYFLWQYKENV
jgi:hypothetical protein